MYICSSDSARESRVHVLALVFTLRRSCDGNHLLSKYIYSKIFALPITGFSLLPTQQRVGTI